MSALTNIRIRLSSAVALAVVVLVGCSEDDPVANGEDLVTISGIVRNIDNRQPAKGIRVSLLGTSYSDNVATGDDGRYSLKVPRGSELHLHTDDFDTQNDTWIPLINIDLPAVTADTDFLDFPIHSCPQSQCPNDINDGRSVAIWDLYLQNIDPTKGDRFVPTSPNNAAGTIVLLMGDCAGVNPDSLGTQDRDSIAVTTNAPEFPVAYLKAGSGAFHCLDGDFIHDATRTMSDVAGYGISWGDPAFTGQTVELTITDMKAQPYRMFVSPVEVPVRPGTLSLTWVVTNDGQPATLKESFCGCQDKALFCTPSP